MFKLAVHGEEIKSCDLFKQQQKMTSWVFSVPPVLEGPLWESLNYTLGSHVALLCEASGVPVPSITWLKDGTPIGKRNQTVLALLQKAAEVFSAGGLCSFTSTLTMLGS